MKASQIFFLFLIVGFSLKSYTQNSINSLGLSAYSENGSLSYRVGQMANRIISVKNVSIEKQKKDRNFKKNVFVYPNPTSGNVILELLRTKTYVGYRLFDVSGFLLLENKLVGYSNIIPTEALKKGTYYLQLVDDKNRSKTFSLVKK